MYMAILANELTFGLAYACLWTYAKSVCVVFVSNTLGIVFDPSVGAITDDSQSAKDIYP